MGMSERREKDRAMAAYLKKKGIRRTTAACPLHCGGSYNTEARGGLNNHFAVCGGKKANR